MMEHENSPVDIAIQERLDHKFKDHEKNVFMQTFKDIILEYRSSQLVLAQTDLIEELEE